MIISDEAIISRNQEIISSNLEDEVVMMSIEKGIYYSLNKIASTIWDVLETECTFAELCEKLMGQFNVDETKCKEDVSFFIEKMKAENLITVK